MSNKTIALIDKCPSNVNYSKYIPFEFDHFHLCSTKMSKILKKDVDIDIDVTLYDLVILVGSEASAYFTGNKSIGALAGHLQEDKFVCIVNPAMLIFKPEGMPEFQKSIDRLISIYNGAYQVNSNGNYIGISDTEEAIKYFREVLDNAVDAVAWDTEGTALYPRDGYVLGLSMTYKDYQGVYILTDCLDDTCMDLLQQIATKFKPIFHNMKYDRKMIAYHLGIDFGDDCNRLEDTMLMHYVLDENSPHGLKDLALKYTDLGDYSAEQDLWITNFLKEQGMKKEDFNYGMIPYDIIKIYGAKDSSATYMLYKKFKPLLEKNDKLMWVYRNLLIDGALMLGDAEEVGLPVNKDLIVYADNYLDSEINRLTEELYSFEELKQFEEAQGNIFNAASPIQLRKLLFDYLNLKPTGLKTDTGADSTNAEALERLAEDHPIPAILSKIRKVSKLKNSYTSKLVNVVDRDSRIRTNFNLHITTSGRLSSSGKFNAQQVPRDDPIIKGCIVAPEGYKIVSQDLKNGELYIAAVLSQDKNLQQVFIDGKDLHSSVAKMVFIPEADVDEIKELYPEYRTASKAINFGILFGSSAKGVADTITKETGSYTSTDTTEEYIRDYFRRFSKLKRYLEERKEFIKANGFTYSFFGRKRRLPNVFSTDRAIASHEVRSGINMEIQSVNIQADSKRR